MRLVRDLRTLPFLYNGIVPPLYCGERHRTFVIDVRFNQPPGRHGRRLVTIVQKRARRPASARRCAGAGAGRRRQEGAPRKSTQPDDVTVDLHYIPLFPAAPQSGMRVTINISVVLFG